MKKHNATPCDSLHLDNDKDNNFVENNPECSNQNSIHNITPIEALSHIAKCGIPDEDGLLIALTAYQWCERAKNMLPQLKLFSEFWCVGELGILFADANQGKSSLAVQIADSISKGIHIEGFNIEAPAQMVLYFDFEMNAKQFEQRYSDENGNLYSFDDNFRRIEINPDCTLPDKVSFEDHLINEIESLIISSGAKILLIDNLTFLGNEIDKAKNALPLMKRLKALKTQYSLSILVLAHSPKRNMNKPLGTNDVHGSKMIMNFCDSAFAIGESARDPNIHYIKQVKQRNTHRIYGEDNICLCQIVKEGSFLGFKVMGYGQEREHLQERSPKMEKEIVNKVIELDAKGESLRRIGEQLGISHMKAKRILDNNKDS